MPHYQFWPPSGGRRREVETTIHGIHSTSRGPSSLGTAPDRKREILARNEAATLAGPRLVEKIDALASVSPRLRGTLLAGFAGPVAHRAGGYRDWALLAAVLVAIGDTGDKLEVYLEAALRHGATDEEILDVCDVAGACAGAPSSCSRARCDAVGAGLGRCGGRRGRPWAEAAVRGRVRGR
ncbi:hypothetical protein [Streptomyces sp. NPDC048106]|uniref:carboxymuconolactone decarboxylase family protein n=1 Tax=Streptomyces sp. NPDC048106 TaxID=3155750 RepID=UPI0034553A27